MSRLEAGFLRRQVERVRGALVEAREAAPERVAGRAITLYGLTLVYSVSWFFAGPIQAKHPFFREGGPIDWLSSVFLAGAAVFAWAAWAAGGRRTRESWVWLTCALGFMFLAVDERFQIHERSSAWFLRLFLETRPFGLGKWNDLTVIGYGLVAFVFVVLMLPAFLRHKQVRLFFGLGFLFYALHTGTDVIRGAFHESWVKDPLEETFKLLAGASFFLGSLQVFLARARRE